MPNPTQSPSSKRTLLLGLIPVVAYAVVEAVYGVFWGLIAGMVLGIGEIIFEYVRYRRVELFTWIANLLIIVLGGVSLFTQTGIWFRLQPAILEFAMAGFLVGSWYAGNPFLVAMGKKQGLFDSMPAPQQEHFQAFFGALSARLGVFFFLHSLLATWAALYWSTAAWAALKGLGFTLSMMVYFAVEMFCFRRRMIQINSQSRAQDVLNRIDKLER